MSLESQEMDNRHLTYRELSISTFRSISFFSLALALGVFF